jgi:hypothetical protein
MGFNKRYINYQNTLTALKSNKLKDYYGKSDTFIFEDNQSEQVYSMFVEGKTDGEIIKLIKINPENEKSN